MRRLVTAFFVSVLLAVAPAATQAQDRGFGIAGSAGAYIPGGEDFEELDAGFGAEGIVSWGWGSGFEIGAGVRWSTHEAEEAELEPEDEGVDLLGIFGEAGWRFNSRPVNSVAVMPFAKARGGYLRADVDSTEEIDDLDGWSIGGKAGVEVWLSRALAITGAASLDFLSLEEAETREGRPTGSLVGITGGVKIRLD